MHFAVMKKLVILAISIETISWINILIVAYRHNFFAESSNLLSYKCWIRAVSYSFAELSNLFFQW